MIGLLGSGLFGGLLGRGGPNLMGASGNPFGQIGGAPGTEMLVNASPSPLGTGPTVKEFASAVAGNMTGGGIPGQGAAGSGVAQATKSVPQGRPTMMQRAQNWMSQDIGNGMSRADALHTIGAGLKDMDPYGRGGNLDATREMFAQRDAKAKAEAERQARAQALAAAMGENGFDGGAYLSALGSRASMDDLVQVERLRDANQPNYLNTANGLFEIMRGKPPSLVQGSAPPMDAPSGFVWANGQLVPIPGGPADPAYISRVTGERREAVVSRPMPGRPRAGGGGGAPWARNWGN